MHEKAEALVAFCGVPSSSEGALKKRMQAKTKTDADFVFRIVPLKSISDFGRRRIYCCGHDGPCFQLGAFDPRATPPSAAFAVPRLLPGAVVNAHDSNFVVVEDRNAMKVAADVHHEEILTCTWGTRGVRVERS